MQHVLNISFISENTTVTLNANSTYTTESLRETKNHTCLLTIIML